MMGGKGYRDVVDATKVIRRRMRNAFSLQEDGCAAAAR